MRNKERFRGLKGKPGKDVLNSLGGGASTWADLGEKTGTVTLTFDGDVTGHEVVEAVDNLLLVKISDDIPTKENMIGAVLTTPQGSITVTENEIIDQGSGAYAATELMLVVSEKTEDLPFAVTSNGIWFVMGGEMYISKLEYTGTVYTPIPKQYLPEDIGGGGGGGGVLRVLVTQNDDETYSASHTYTEIEEAFFAGKVVECILRNWIFALAVMPGASGYVTYGAALPITFTVMIPEKTAPYYISIAGNDKVTVNTGE